MGTHPLAPSLAAVCLLAGLSCAAAGATAAFQGTLAGATGEPLSGTYLLSFALRGAPASQAWSEALYVKARGGAYTVILGASRPLPDGGARADAIEVSSPAGTGWKAGPLSALAPTAAAAPVAPSEVQAAAAPARPHRYSHRAGASKAVLPDGLYEVQPGDTLRSVAEKVYGDAARWKDIYDANDDRVQRGGDLIPGMRLIIPRRAD